jgi:hypothetical protein
VTPARKRSLLFWVWGGATIIGAAIRVWFCDDDPIWFLSTLGMVILVGAYRLTAKDEATKRKIFEEGYRYQRESTINEARRRLNAEKGIQDLWEAVGWMCRQPGRKIEVKFHDSTHAKMVDIEHHTPN